MDKRQILEELEKKYNQIGAEFATLGLEINSFKSKPEYAAYASYTEDTVKESMFPKEYAMFKRFEELKVQVNAFSNEVKNAARNVSKEINESIANLEAKIKTNEEYVKSLEEKIEAKKNEIEQIKNSEEYKNGDEATKLKVEELEEELELATKRKEKITNSIKDTKQQIEDVKKEKEDLIAAYGEEIDVGVEEQEASAPEAEEENNSRKPKNRIFATAPAVETELSPEEQAEKEKEAKLKADFKELYVKAKKGTLTEQEFNDLAEIMKDPANYDKLGITTGAIFNKSKVILKAMAGYASKTRSTVTACKDKFGIDYDKPSEENGLISTSSIKDWKGLTELTANPDRELVSEEFFKRVVTTKNRDDLTTDEERKAWDDANAHLNQFSTLREVLKVYDDVSTTRQAERTSWFSRSKKDTKPALGAAEPVTTSQDDKMRRALEQGVNRNPDFNDVDSRQPRSQEPPTV